VVLILTKSDLEKMLSIKDVIEIVRMGFLELAKGTAILPSRTGITVGENTGWLGVMPAHLALMGALSTKIVTVFAGNSEKGLPTTIATILLNSVETGAPLAIMDGTFVTALRTGAVSGLATKHLARHNSTTVGVFGAGIQARTQLLAVCAVRRIKRGLVFDKVEEKARLFANEMSRTLKMPIERCDPEDIVKQSDIIVTATTSKAPIFDGNLVRPGTHLNLIGAFTPDTREVDDALIGRSKIVVDEKTSALKEAGDIIIPIRGGIITEDDIYAELGQLVAGIKAGRTSETEITLFKSIGLGVQDCATAWLAYTKARQKGGFLDVDLS